ncbi:hypothetical protein OPW41_12435 [Vibrio europaeus]|uniref:hypothetical protein n=1 Tax=Vibrio europaeus TaxID=300876 RepID=UPI00233E91B4|nr:hypothetical protein [Vibrio europaeus]MDC5721837.1 hypothetical protein [Vibrio europaeus]MDC5758224.1 hypothetical protein [Vibrio europaeus]MDC5776501.1 hypothetical protein [Vibrio europaeus]MDC5795640.1 hypothetical protein [Vibrio europaeus]MDC5801583.1 hypothetical protein [Vibrio europaeus]
MIRVVTLDRTALFALVLRNRGCVLTDSGDSYTGEEVVIDWPDPSTLSRVCWRLSYAGIRAETGLHRPPWRSACTIVLSLEAILPSHFVADDIEAIASLTASILGQDCDLKRTGIIIHELLL